MSTKASVKGIGNWGYAGVGYVGLVLATAAAACGVVEVLSTPTPPFVTAPAIPALQPVEPSSDASPVVTDQPQVEPAKRSTASPLVYVRQGRARPIVRVAPRDVASRDVIASDLLEPTPTSTAFGPDRSEEFSFVTARPPVKTMLVGALYADAGWRPAAAGGRWNEVANDFAVVVSDVGRPEILESDLATIVAAPVDSHIDRQHTATLPTPETATPAMHHSAPPLLNDGFSDGWGEGGSDNLLGYDVAMMGIGGTSLVDFPPALVPEPASLLSITLAACLLRRRRSASHDVA